MTLNQRHNADPLLTGRLVHYCRADDLPVEQGLQARSKLCTMMHPDLAVHGTVCSALREELSLDHTVGAAPAGDMEAELNEWITCLSS